MSAKVSSVPAPNGGLDAFNSLVSMPPDNAIALVNWYPNAYGCSIRKGYRQHATGLGATVKSLIAYNPVTGANKLYAFAGTNMYECSTPGAVGAAVLTGLVQSIWDGVMLANSAGTHLICFSGSDNGIWIGPAGVQRLVAGDGIVNATWSGVNPALLISPITHQKRLWAVEKNTANAWYLPPDQVYGVATKFDFGPLFKRGGSLAGLATWTVDDGDGSDDHLVAISTKGEVAVYRGIDPSTAATWGLQGVYRMGEPVLGSRFFGQVAGDVKFITEQGLVSLNSLLTSNTVSTAASTVEAKLVQQPLSETANLLGDLTGWQLYFCLPLNMLLINVPSVTSEGSMQFVENIISSKWTQFKGWNASCFATFNSLPFFGGSGVVYQGWSGNTDNVTFADSQGQPITALAQQAYSFLDAPGVNKQIGMFRPTFVVEGNCDYAAEIVYDYSFEVPVVSIVNPPTTESLWDTALWDSALWAGGLKSQKDWSQGQGMGFAASLIMAAQSKFEVLWVSTDYTHITGGPL